MKSVLLTHSSRDTILFVPPVLRLQLVPLAFCLLHSNLIYVPLKCWNLFISGDLQMVLKQLLWIMNYNSTRLKLKLSCFWSIFCFFNQNFHEFSQRSIIFISRFWTSFYDCEAENGRVRNILQNMDTQIQTAFFNTKFIQ